MLTGDKMYGPNLHPLVVAYNIMPRQTMWSG